MDETKIKAEANTIFQKIAKAVGAHPKTAIAVAIGAFIGIYIVTIIL